MLDLTPHASASHWCARWIGQAWSERFTCWHLVMEVQAQRFGRRMPAIDVSGQAPDQHQVLAALMRTGDPWRPVALPPQLQGGVAAIAREGDVLLMRAAAGPHVGIIVQLHGRPQVLHNIGGRRDDGTLYGGVRVDELGELGRLDFGHLRLWRAGP